MYALSPEPKKLLLLAGTEHGTDLFRTRAGEGLTGAMLDFIGSLSRVDVNPSGTLIASISWDGTVRLWGVIK